MEGDDLGGEHTMQHTDDMLWNSAPETCIILFTSVTPINSIRRRETAISLEMRRQQGSREVLVLIPNLGGKRARKKRRGLVGTLLCLLKYLKIH